MRSTLVAATVTGLMLVALAARAADDQAPPSPASQPDVAAPSGPLIPRAEPLAPRPFTLEDRYLDAVRRGDLAMMKLSLEKGADLHAKDGFERSALLLAVRDARDLEMAEILHERGLAVDEADSRGRTPLGYAAGNGDVEIVAYLLDQGAAVDRKDLQQQTPLYHAVLGGSKATVERLLAAGARVDVRDQFGDTPLIGACAKGFDEIARLLVDKGADVGSKDQEGRTARERAAPSASFCRGLGSSVGP